MIGLRNHSQSAQLQSRIASNRHESSHGECRSPRVSSLDANDRTSREVSGDVMARDLTRDCQ
jgi:hypothetical protein